MLLLQVFSFNAFDWQELIDSIVLDEDVLFVAFFFFILIVWLASELKLQFMIIGFLIGSP